MNSEPAHFPASANPANHNNTGWRSSHTSGNNNNWRPPSNHSNNNTGWRPSPNSGIRFPAPTNTGPNNYCIDRPPPRPYLGHCQICDIQGHTAKKCPSFRLVPVQSSTTTTSSISSPQTPWQPRAHCAMQFNYLNSCLNYISCEEVSGSMSLPSGTFTPENPSLFSDDNSNRTQEISQIGEQNVVKETVGLDLGKSSNKRQKKLRSEVWNDFEKYTDENGKDWAKCNICKKPFNGSSKMGTTHLKNHFKSCSKNKSNEGGGSASGDKPAEDSVMDQQLNHLDKSIEGGGSASGVKPVEKSVMDPQLNRLDMVKMLIKRSYWSERLPNSIEAADLINVYKEEKEKLRIYFEKLPCRLSLMINIDESVCKECICLLVFFIDDDWELKEKIISWKCIGGDPIMKILKNVLSEWGIDNNISYMVLDGYCYDHVLSSNERETGFSSQGSLLFNGKLFFIPDFHDIGDISSKCIYEIVNDRMKEIFKYIIGNGNFRIAIDRAKLLGKKVTTEVIPTEQDLEYMEIDDLVEMGFGLKEAFFELENMENEFKSINLTKEEWDLMPTFSDPTDEDTFGYDCETANMYFPWICNIYTISLEFVKLKPSIYEDKSFHSLRDRMKCWYDDNLVLAVAAVLDPRFRLNIVKHWYKKIYGDECDTRLAKFMDYLTSVYNEYAKGTNNFQSSASGSKEKKSSISYEMLDPSGKPCKHHRSPNFELHLYLEDFKFPLIRDFNILDWWQSNTRYFPTLARMARDFLSIQITIPYDYLSSIIPKPHMHFDSDMVKKEAFMCVRDWL